MNARLTINLNDFSKARKFINESSKFFSDIDVIRDRYVIDGKSAIGIFTLDLSKPIDVEIHSDDPYEIKRFNDIMNEFK
jgi:phosphotransferase system HPr-like phosphotransfer protein